MVTLVGAVHGVAEEAQARVHALYLFCKYELQQGVHPISF